MLKSRFIYSNYIPSILDRIGTVVDDLIRCLQNDCGGIYDETVFDLRVILNEVLINAIIHGNCEDASKNVKIDAGITEDGDIFLIIEDEGAGYDFSEFCSRQKFLSETDYMNENGRGIMIIRGLCDKVKVNKKGNKIVIVKKMDKSAPQMDLSGL